MEPMPVNDLRPWISQGARGMITRGLGITTEHPDFESTRKAFMDIYAECLSRHTTWWPGWKAHQARACALSAMARHQA